MPLSKLQFRPGVNRENTNYTNEGGWYDMDKVRFRFGTPEKIGGWKQAVGGTFSGVARSIVCWASLSGEVMIGVGTNYKYYVNYGGQYQNITPVRSVSATLTSPFSTAINSPVVRVQHAAHGAVPGDVVVFSNAATVNGISAATINSTTGYRIVSIIDSNTYTVDMGQTATATDQGGGNVQITYELSAGLAAYTIGGGFGAGYWNGPITSSTIQTTLTSSGRVALNATDTTINVASTTGFTATGTLVIDAEIVNYTGLTSTSFTGCTRGVLQSTASTHACVQNGDGTFNAVTTRQVLGYAGANGWGQATDASFGVGLQMRVWSTAVFGQDLIICPRGGTLYYWTKNLVTYPRATALYVVGDTKLQYVPQRVNYVLNSDARIVLALGANGYAPNTPNTAFDPMLLRWSAQNDPTNWVPASTNQAGEYRLSAGSYIMSGVNTKQETLIWTDAALYSAQYVGPPYVFRTSLIMANLSIMGPNAFAVVNNVAYWMGSDKFYKYDGTVNTLTCPVQQYIFNDISFAQSFQAFAGTNEGFNEVWWFYVSNTEIANATNQSRDPTPDKYVVYNHNEDIWYFGTLNRTCWIDSPLYQGPLATTGTSTQGSMVMHEQGTDDGTTSSLQPIDAYIQSADFNIGDGQHFMFVTRLLPDISFNGSVVPNPYALMTLMPRQNAGVDYVPKHTDSVLSTQLYSPVKKQYTVQQFTPQIDTRVRGRQMALRIESDTLGVQWKLGVPRIDMRPDGRKS